MLHGSAALFNFYSLVQATNRSNRVDRQRLPRTPLPWALLLHTEALAETPFLKLYTIVRRFTGLLRSTCSDWKPQP